jgi:hypothetical protein
MFSAFAVYFEAADVFTEYSIQKASFSLKNKRLLLGHYKDIPGSLEELIVSLMSRVDTTEYVLKSGDSGMSVEYADHGLTIEQDQLGVIIKCGDNNHKCQEAIDLIQSGVRNLSNKE